MKRIVVSLFAAALLQALTAETFVVNDGETLELVGTSSADPRNIGSNTVQLHGGGTLKLKPDGVYANLNCKIELMGGIATLDCTELDSSSPAITSGIRDFNVAGAGLKIKGAKTLKVNSGSTAHVQIHDLPFVDADGNPVDDGKLSLAGGIILCWPTNCAHEIVAGGTVYFCAPEPLLTGDVTLDTYDLWLYNDTSLEKTAKITVNSGRTLYLKPINYPTWTAAVPTGATNSNDIVLNGGTLKLASMPTHYVDGSITGNGTVATGVSNSHGNWDAEATYLRSPNITFAGTVKFSSSHNRLAFTNVASPGDPDNEVQFGGTGAAWLLFYDANNNGPENVTVGKVKVTANYPYTIGVAPHQTVAVGAFSNTVAAPGSPVLSAKGAGTLTLPSGTYGLKVQSAADQTDFYSCKDGPIDFTGKNPRAITAVADGQVVANVPSTCALSASEGTRLTVYNENGGKVLPASGEIVLSAAWRELPVLWLDASAADTLHGLGEDVLPNELQHMLDAGMQDPKTLYMTVYTNNYPIVEGWHDCRGRTAYMGFNTRLYNDVWAKPPKWAPYRQNYPYVVPYGSNGLAYLNFARCGETGKGTYTDINGTVSQDGTQYRRMPIMISGTKDEANIPATLVVMVFGSQQGGGKALLGTKSGAFGRTADNLNAGITTNATARVWMNGTEVDPTTTKLSGGWDVITIDATGYQVNGLGWLDVYSTGGGQNYAEVIIYTNACTAATRVLAERYLAKKWKLYDKYADDTSVAEPTMPLFLQGAPDVSVSVAAGVSSPIYGKFTGTVGLDGGTLDLTDAKSAPAFADLPANGRIGWYDPDNTNGFYRVKSGTRDEVQGMFDSGIEPLPGTNFLWAPTSRRPQWKREARGLGPVRGWLDLNDPSPNDTSTGNCLRPRQYPDTDWHSGANHGTALSIPVKTVVMAIDSSQGGGSPMSADGVDSGRFAEDISVPIWPPKSDSTHAGNGITDTMRNGVTCLDGAQVASPTTTGFNGRPEVLSLTTTTAWNLASFGRIANTEHGRQNGAILGEIFLYNVALSADERLKVEAYLMDKWIGKLPDGYGDVRQATVTGSGRIVAADFTRLPKVEADFSGVISAGAGASEAHVPVLIGPSGEVTGAILVPNAQLACPSSVAFDVTNAGKVPFGDHVLMTCRSFATPVTATVSFAGKAPRRYALLNTTDGEGHAQIVLRVTRVGLAIVYR